MHRLSIVSMKPGWLPHDITFGCFSIWFRFLKHIKFSYQPFSLEVFARSQILVPFASCSISKYEIYHIRPCDVVYSINPATVAIVLGLPGARGRHKMPSHNAFGSEAFQINGSLPVFSVRSVGTPGFSKAHTTPRGCIRSGAMFPAFATRLHQPRNVWWIYPTSVTSSRMHWQTWRMSRNEDQDSESRFGWHSDVSSLTAKIWRSLAQF